MPRWLKEVEVDRADIPVYFRDTDNPIVDEVVQQIRRLKEQCND